MRGDGVLWVTWVCMATAVPGCTTESVQTATDAAVDVAVPVDVAATPDSGPFSDVPGGAPMGTCTAYCQRLLAPGCVGTPAGFTMVPCVASCTHDQSQCVGAGMGAAYQRYLDCVQINPVVCTATTMTPSSPACVAQGLDILGCAGSPGDAGTADSGH